MPRHMQYSDAERKLAWIARKKAGSRDVLYHGTRYAGSILRTGVLFRAPCLNEAAQVCLTRSAEVAAYWAMMERDDDEGIGSILIFDRKSLEGGYELRPIPDVFWHNDALFHDEAEEEIRANIIDVNEHLIGVISGPRARPLPRRKELNSRNTDQIKARLQELQLQMMKASSHAAARSDAGKRAMTDGLEGLRFAPRYQLASLVGGLPK
jgi:hypothetical protein